MSTLKEVTALIENLMEKCDNLESAMASATDEFNTEVAEMSQAVSALEKIFPLEIDELYDLKEAAKLVVKSWERGDLASAVNNLESVAEGV